MKLVKFKVQNFRGLKGEHNEIQFKKSDIIFLIGQNNTGKSTFLRAYEFFTNSKQKATLDDFYNQDITNTIKMEGWFELEKDDDKDKSYSKSDPDWATKWVNSDGYIKIKNIKDQRQVVMGEFIQLEDDLKELKLQLDTVQSDEFVEKTAREELGLVKPGEQLIILAEPNVGGFDTTPRKDLNIEIGD